MALRHQVVEAWAAAQDRLHLQVDLQVADHSRLHLQVDLHRAADHFHLLHLAAVIWAAAVVHSHPHLQAVVEVVALALLRAAVAALPRAAAVAADLLQVGCIKDKKCLS